MRSVKCHEVLLLLLGLFLILITGCGTLENGRGWGQDAVYPVNGKRISKAFYNAVDQIPLKFPDASLQVSATALLFDLTGLLRKIQRSNSQRRGLEGASIKPMSICRKTSSTFTRD